MFKKKGLIFSIICTCILLLALPNLTNGATEEPDIWSEKQVNDPKKVWTIAFSKPLKAASIKNSTVYVEDENYRLVFTTATLSSDKKSIIVKPRVPYEEDKKYRLNITQDVVSEKGEKIKKPIILPFVVKAEDGTASGDIIRSVTFAANNFAMVVNVVSGDTVNRVTANSKDMLYLGNNTYSIGLTNVTSGSTVEIQAYDHSGKRLYSKDHRVN